MARPGIVRADTLDLQDQENPTAAEHQRHPQSNGIAPHQASQVQHVMEERHSEEQALQQEVWGVTGQLNDDPNEHGQSNGQERADGDGGEGGDSEGEGDDDMMDRISSSPSIDDEDIDFEFVYALHTFVATVEGQANATKGDTMVLLDDSNSYWWLVRVVKDSSIGYLPAEHIETPTERLARLNKHRNIDLSATMLSDNSEKSRNPLKKAMRRRNAKTVQFAAPTYVEASDYDYSSEEEGDMIEPYAAAAQASAQAKAAAADKEAEPKDTTTEGRSSTSSNRASFDREQAATAASALAAAGVGDDEPQLSPKLVDKTEAAPLKSRKGTPRNADSFLKDDTIETRKITLTPGLLREDNTALRSPTESTRTTSLESLHKVVSPSEESKKDEKKKKDSKKGGMLSGLFKSKKKDKKSKDGAENEEKMSFELSRDSVRTNSAQSDKSNGPVSPISARNKNIKQPVQPEPAAADQTQNGRAASPEGFLAELPGSEVALEMATGDEDAIRAAPTKPRGPLTGILKSSNNEKPKKAKRAKERVELDDFDSPSDDDDEDDDEVDESSNTFMHGTEIVHIPMPDGDNQQEDEDEDEEEDEADEPGSLTSSPSIIEHPAEPADSLAREKATTPTAAGFRSPPSANTTTTPPPRSFSADSLTSGHLSPPPTNGAHGAAATASPGWNDSSLRAWLEDGREVRDMLVMIHDKSGVTPVAPDHPLMSGLFVESRKGVQEMMGQLDGLLGTFLQRKGVRY